MTPGARLSAAIEVLQTIDGQRRPAADCLKDWGVAHRFAGSKDRAAIAGLVYDCLRVKASAAWVMGDEAPRALVLGMLRTFRGLTTDSIGAMASGEGHAIPALTANETLRLADATLNDAPDHVRGDYPEWLSAAFDDAFGSAAVDEGRAMATRAPLDLRVNTLKSNRDKAMRALAHLDPQPTPLSPDGLRFAVGEDGRSATVTTDPSYVKGHVEIQDEGSQLVSRLSGAKAGQQVLDLCAGGGGKALALAALMGNKGQIYATDDDVHRIAPIYDRIARADARNIQVRGPKRGQDVIKDLEDRCDLVLVDAPCSGTGTWRRHPDAKWRMRPGALAERCKDQDEVLQQALRFVKPGGRVVYITCSVLRQENEDRIARLILERSDLAVVDGAALAQDAGLPTLADRASRLGPGLRLTPHTTGTDGFYVVALTRP